MLSNKLLYLCTIILFTTFSYGQKDKVRKLAIDLSDYEYPHQVSFITLHEQGQDLRMAFMDVKPQKPNGKSIMLLHGKNFNGAYWGETIDALTAKGYRVIVPDQVGFGKSTKPMHFQYSFQQLAINTKQVLDSLHLDKVTVLGHSMGGMLATRFALMYPETTEKFVLLNPIGLEDYKLKVPYQSIDTWYAGELKKDYESIKAYQEKNYYDNHWKPEYDEWVNLLAGWTLNDDYSLIAYNAALTYDMIFTQPVVYEFQDITSPTLLIIGTRDRTALGKPLVSPEVRKTMGLYNELGKRTQQKIPNSQLVELEGLGHLPHIEAFDRFIQPLLEFLAQ
ncbi:MAG: alpha/beta hydrolase [Cytophagaceae bacterium]|nr:alpha/beta hydrolase [Cytophagaceae bacterium]